jgi:Family of unknown function (DUF5681)
VTGSVTTNGRWQPGQSGNLAGRPIGTRNKFSETFVADIAATWERHGASILERMALRESARFAELCSRLIPRDVQVSLSTRMPGNLEAEDWQLALLVFEAVKQAVPDANKRQPSEVLQFVLNAVRAHDAKLIEQ